MADDGGRPAEPADTIPPADGHAPATSHSGRPPSPSAAWLPDQFDAVGPPLGTGATAVVWPVRHRLDGREFALKVWRRPLAGGADRDRFRREVRRYVALNDVSGHIVTYSWADEGTSGDPPWIGMQRHGRSLHQVTEGGRPPLEIGLVYGADLLAGLAAMHRNGMLHRDVKPANLVTDEGRAKLCDLGLALDSAASTQDGAAGTPRYLAPELLDGHSVPSTRSDVYSAAQTIRDLVGPDTPEPLAQLLTEAGSVNPHDRPADAGAFEERFRRSARALRIALPAPLPAARRTDGVEGAAPPGELVKTPRRARRWRRSALTVVVLLAACAAGVAVVRPWENRASVDAGSPFAGSTGSVPPQWPDAARAPTDISADGAAVVLPTTESGRCDVVVEGAERVGDEPYTADGVELARLWIYFGADRQQACAKLVKPNGSPYNGVRTHLALTLCGDGNSCDFDWNSYSIDAGPLVVPSRAGCVSSRVSMMDDTGDRWLVRGDVRWFGCPG
jgi:hypothetical protein